MALLINKVTRPFSLQACFQLFICVKTQVLTLRFSMPGVSLKLSFPAAVEGS